MQSLLAGFHTFLFILAGRIWLFIVHHYTSLITSFVHTFSSVHVALRLKVLNDYVPEMRSTWDSSNLRTITIVPISYYALRSFGAKLHDVWEEVNGSSCHCKKNIASKHKITDYSNRTKGAATLYLLKHLNIWTLVWSVMGIDS